MFSLLCLATFRTGRGHDLPSSPKLHDTMFSNYKWSNPCFLVG